MAVTSPQDDTIYLGFTVQLAVQAHTELQSEPKLQHQSLWNWVCSCFTEALIWLARRRIALGKAAPWAKQLTAVHRCINLSSDTLPCCKCAKSKCKESSSDERSSSLPQMFVFIILLLLSSCFVRKKSSWDQHGNSVQWQYHSFVSQVTVSLFRVLRDSITVTCLNALSCCRSARSRRKKSSRDENSSRWRQPNMSRRSVQRCKTRSS